jgi:hypothetical protein
MTFDADRLFLERARYFTKTWAQRAKKDGIALEAHLQLVDAIDPFPRKSNGAAASVGEYFSRFPDHVICWHMTGRWSTN